MELVVLVAIGVLLIIFVGSLLALILLCRHRRAQANAAGWLNEQKPMLKYSRDGMSEGLGNEMNPNIESEVDDMLQLSPNIAKILQDNDWIYDASGLVHHSLAILRICHQITDQLSGLTFNPVPNNQEAVDDVRDWTRRIMPRVDDLVRTMYLCSRRGVQVGLQATLLEARAAALVMAVSGVTTSFRAAYPRAAANGELTWLRTAIHEMEQHLEALRLAAEHEENAQREKVEVIMRGGASSTPSDVNVGASTSGVNDTPSTSSHYDSHEPSTSGSIYESGTSTPTIVDSRHTNHDLLDHNNVDDIDVTTTSNACNDQMASPSSSSSTTHNTTDESINTMIDMSTVCVPNNNKLSSSVDENVVRGVDDPSDGIDTGQPKGVNNGDIYDDILDADATDNEDVIENNNHLDPLLNSIKTAPKDDRPHELNSSKSNNNNNGSPYKKVVHNGHHQPLVANNKLQNE